MAVVEMKRIHVYALKDNRKKILEMLQRKAVLEVNNPEEAQGRERELPELPHQLLHPHG